MAGCAVSNKETEIKVRFDLSKFKKGCSASRDLSIQKSKITFHSGGKLKKEIIVYLEDFLMFIF